MLVVSHWLQFDKNFLLPVIANQKCLQNKQKVFAVCASPTVIGM
jgi:hypothetical protein